MPSLGRRRVVGGLGTAALTLGALGFPAPPVRSQKAPLKLGLVMPFTGIYAPLTRDVRRGFELFVSEKGGELGGRSLEFLPFDTELDPARVDEALSYLLDEKKAEILIGPVHSGLALAMISRIQDTDTLLIVPSAGANEITGALCARNVFRSCFSHWQVAHPCGQVVASDGHRRVLAMSWNSRAGQQSTEGFASGLEAAGGRVVETFLVPFPSLELGSYFQDIEALEVDACYAYFSGQPAVDFLQHYESFGLKERLPLYGAGFLTEGTLADAGASAEGVVTTLHYADDLDLERNIAFRAAYLKAFGAPPSVHSVHGYDTAQLLANGLEAVGGDAANLSGMEAALAAAEVDSPRGRFRLSASHNPVQNIYRRIVRDGENRVEGLAAALLAAPADGCPLG